MGLSGKTEVEVQRLNDAGGVDSCRDAVVTEEPLEIRLDTTPVAVVMRTPGHDMELAVGFLFTEGILQDPDQVLSVAYCKDTTDEAAGNIVRVLAEGADLEAMEAARRQVYASSSCGLCGKTTLDAVRLLVPPLQPIGPLKRSLLAGLPDTLRAHQDLFDSTGGLHAAALCSTEGDLIVAREDVGRHNACDKVLGSMILRETWPLASRILVLSGRASFEMVQKAAMAGIGAIVAVSAPSSLAIEFAIEQGITLVGFVRRGTMNVYSGDVVP
ncbi:MAG: formate dehydrogenase accessory sulfurtransferase FdhD [Myxococcota bacterium]|nr:formate dehydrogenase accessory sulfurtransferase FdhD [Myxococcota bacterium]